jgi:hypothetical protein
VCRNVCRLPLGIPAAPRWRRNRWLSSEGPIGAPRLDLRDLVVSLSAGLLEGSGIAADSGARDYGSWPPLYRTLALVAEGDRAQVDRIVRALSLSESDYDEAVALTRAVLAGPLTQRWIARTAVQLQRRGYMTGEEIEQLRPSTRTKETAAA